MKKILKQNRGITLIALVVTIIVLLILAGVTIATLTGDNGLLVKAGKASKEHDISGAKEQVELLASEYKIDYYEESEKLEEKTIGAYVSDKFESGRKIGDYTLTKNGNIIVLKSSDKTKIAIGNINTDGVIEWTNTITNITSDLTIGQIYNDNMIGQEMSYKSDNNYSNWIVFGPEIDDNGNKTGNILLASKEPINNAFDLYLNAKSWLFYDKKIGEEGYEEQENGKPLSLNKACEIYGGYLQSKPVRARSIGVYDIDYVMGYPSTNVIHHTFGTEKDDNKNESDEYYPSMLGANRTVTNGKARYFVKAGETIDGKLIEKKEFITISSGKFSENSVVNKPYNNNYVYGINNSYEYVIGNKLGLGGNNGTNAAFSISGVKSGVPYTGYIGLAFSYNNFAINLGDYTENPKKVSIRPVVIIPGDVKVEEISTGVFDFIK